jgi:hypothetical protein
MGMDFKIVNPSNGRSGGVLMLWKKEVHIQQIFSAPNYIDVRVVESPGKIWRLTGIYGESRWEDKYKTWDKIRELHAQCNLPWAIIGDFNEILFTHEKEGGNQRPLNFMQAFRDVLSDCGLEDLGYVGDPFTWKRGRIRERLDRVVTNNSWVDMHPDAMVTHLEYTRSDHRPLLLDTEYQPSQASNKSSPRRFERKCLQEKNFRDIVEKAWEDASLVAGSDGVMAKLGRMHSTMHDWDKKFLKQPKKNGSEKPSKNSKDL